MKVEIKIIGSSDDPVAAAQAAVDGAGMADGNKQCNPPLMSSPEPVAIEAEPEEESEQASVMEIKFASVIAARLADELNLSPSVFEGVEPSGKRGYTIADVKWIAE